MKRSKTGGRQPVPARSTLSGHVDGPKRCYHCGTVIVPMPGRQCRVLTIARQEVDLDRDGNLTNVGPIQVLWYHRPCARVADDHADSVRTA